MSVPRWVAEATDGSSEWKLRSRSCARGARASNGDVGSVQRRPNKQKPKVGQWRLRSARALLQRQSPIESIYRSGTNWDWDICALCIWTMAIGQPIIFNPQLFMVYNRKTQTKWWTSTQKTPVKMIWYKYQLTKQEVIPTMIYLWVWCDQFASMVRRGVNQSYGNGIWEVLLPLPWTRWVLRFFVLKFVNLKKYSVA